MSYEVRMPRLGWSMEKGRLVEWCKKPNEWVDTGQVLLLVESDKAIQEVEALESGNLYIPPGAPTPGSEVTVGTLLGYLLHAGEAIPEPIVPADAPVEASAPQAAEARAATTESDGTRPPAISPRARRVAAELAVDWGALKGSGRTGRIVERDIRQAAEASMSRPDAVRVTPVARRVAQELGVDVKALAAQMPGKPIQRADVERAAGSALQVPQPSSTPAAEIPFTQIRRIVADRMAASAHTTAPVTLTTEVDATELVLLRARLKSDAGNGAEPVPSYTDLLTKIAAKILTEHPALNARLDGDRILSSPAVHIGLAVDTERGLLVPVLRDAHIKSVAGIARESAQLIERARSGRLGPDEMQGGTFTITNLGMFDIDAFTPIINLPECAILGVGRIKAKPVVVEGQGERVQVRQMMFLSLTFDHRIVDGAPAARFLQRIKYEIEHPYACLLS